MADLAVLPDLDDVEREDAIHAPQPYPAQPMTAPAPPSATRQRQRSPSLAG